MTRDSNCGRQFVILLFLGFAVIMAACGKKQEEEAETDGTVYTDEEVYIESSECRYISELPDSFIIMIETPEHLEYAEKNYDLEETLKSLSGQYDIAQYTYIIQYNVTTHAGYYYHADKVVINDYGPYFHMDLINHSSKSGSGPLVMGGFIHMAAVPKEYLSGYNFTSEYIIYPGENEKRGAEEQNIPLPPFLRDISRIYSQKGRKNCLQTRCPECIIG